MAASVAGRGHHRGCSFRLSNGGNGGDGDGSGDGNDGQAGRPLMVMVMVVMVMVMVVKRQTANTDILVRSDHAPNPPLPVTPFSS